MAKFSMLKDVRYLPKTVVIIDVFRSSNTIIELLHRGAERVIPVKSVEDAIKLKNKHPSWILLGEREGKKIDGFDGDNSPTQDMDKVEGATVVLTTSGGTRCIDACKEGREVVIGSFANTGAVIKTLRHKNKSTVGFWAVGVSGLWLAEEDELCADWFSASWDGDRDNYFKTVHQVQQGSGAKRLRELSQYRDLKFCLERDIRTEVPRLKLAQDRVWSLTLC
jgi:2-phosphosulfolactate phosphatase